MKLLLISIIASAFLFSCRNQAPAESEVKVVAVGQKAETCNRQDVQNQIIKNFVATSIQIKYPNKADTLKALGLKLDYVFQNFQGSSQGEYSASFTKITDKKSGARAGLEFKVIIKGLKKTSGGYDTSEATIEFISMDFISGAPC